MFKARSLWGRVYETILNKHNMIKNPNWQEADQLAIYKHDPLSQNWQNSNFLFSFSSRGRSKVGGGGGGGGSLELEVRDLPTNII